MSSSGPDPRNPLVIDTRALQLQRRPGSMITVERDVVAPEGFGVVMARVPVDSTIELDLRLESVMEGVWLSGSADIEVEGECARCLEPVGWGETLEIAQMFEYAATDSRGAIIPTAEGDEDEALPVILDDLIDLTEVLRDAVVLALPLAPLCSAECPGLCPECGIVLAEAPGHAHEQIDPRWAALGGLVEPDESQR
ncbi:MAG: YceD family protein [Candidatus Nanopelagicales bacterium]